MIPLKYINTIDRLKFRGTIYTNLIELLGDKNYRSYDRKDGDYVNRQSQKNNSNTEFK